MKMERTVLVKTAYGEAWKENGETYVRFHNNELVYKIREGEIVETGYTLEQTLGSWGPTQDLRMYLENRK